MKLLRSAGGSCWLVAKQAFQLPTVPVSHQCSTRVQPELEKCLWHPYSPKLDVVIQVASIVKLLCMTHRGISL